MLPLFEEQKNINQHHTYFSADCGCLPFILNKFPSDDETKRKWVKLVNRQKDDVDRTRWQPTTNSVICSKHFRDGIPTDNNPLPTLELGYNVHQQLGSLPVVRKPAATAPRPKQVTLPSTCTSKEVAEKSPEMQPLDVQDDQPPTLSAPLTQLICRRPVSNEVDIPQTADPIFGCFSDLEVKPKVAVFNNSATSPVPTQLPEETKRYINKLQGSLMTKTINLKTKTQQLKLHLRPLHKKLLQTDKDSSFYTGIHRLQLFYVICTYFRHSALSAARDVSLTVKLKYKKLQNTCTSQPTSIKLSIEDRILLVLMRLRLGLLRKDLADR